MDRNLRSEKPSNNKKEKKFDLNENFKEKERRKITKLKYKKI